MVHRGYQTSKFVLFASGTRNSSCLLGKYTRTVSSGRASHWPPRPPLAFSSHDATRPTRTALPERKFSCAVLAARHRTGPGRRIRARICASRSAASFRAESHPHLAHRGNKRRKHSWRCLCQRRATLTNYRHLPHASLSGHCPLARLAPGLGQQSAPWRTNRARLRSALF